LTLVIAILGLALLVFIHELGHFLAARLVKMNPRRFYIGFPPALVKVRRKGIEYGIGAIPLGGYVKIPGMRTSPPSGIAPMPYSIPLRLIFAIAGGKPT